MKAILMIGIMLLAGECARAEEKPNLKTSGATETEQLAPNLQPSTPCFRPKSDQYYQWAMDRHNDLVKQAKEADIEVAFYGDSLIQFLDDEVWAREARPLKAGNFGISSDRVEHLLWRLQHGELEGLKRLKVAVVMIGSNNYGSPSSAASIAEGIGLVLKTIRQRQPQARILLLGLSPEGWNKDDDSRRRIRAINALLAGFQARKLCNAYLDWGDVLLHADGSMNRRLSKDGCHYSKAGSEAFFSAVKPAVLKCLKEVAEKLEAENAVILGKATVFADPKASRATAVKALGQRGSGLRFDNAPAAKKLAIRYASKTEMGTYSVQVNDRPPVKVNFHSTGAWDTYYTNAIIDVDIPAGATLKLLSQEGDGEWSIDYILLGTDDLGLKPDIWNLPRFVPAAGKYARIGNRWISIRPRNGSVRRSSASGITSHPRWCRKRAIGITATCTGAGRINRGT